MRFRPAEGTMENIFQDAEASAPAGGRFGSQFRRFIQGGPSVSGGDEAASYGTGSYPMDQMMNLPIQSPLSGLQAMCRRRSMLVRSRRPAKPASTWAGSNSQRSRELKASFWNPSITEGAITRPTSAFGNGVVTSQGAAQLEMAAGMPLFMAGATGQEARNVGRPGGGCVPAAC